MIRGRISSDVDILRELHAMHPWIPNSEQIRPSKHAQEEKRKKSEAILLEWMTFKDFILDSHFGYSTAIYRGRLYVPGPVSTSMWCFSPCMFPYALDGASQHFVLWNSYHDIQVEFDNEVINQQITESLQKIVGNDNFDFVWYKNPRPTLPELYHVQVFWIST